MATEPVNERPIFPALLQVSALGIGQWSTSMIRQLTTVFQQYGYRLNKALLDEDLDTNGGGIVTDGGDSVLRDSNLAQNSGTIPEIDQAATWTGGQTFTPAQIFSAAPASTGNPLRFDELEANGGSILEETTSGVVIQNKFTSTGAVVTSTTRIPYDDTIPQITEGAEALSITFTPKSASSRIKVSANLQMRGSRLDAVQTVALFLAGQSDSIGVGVGHNDPDNGVGTGINGVLVVADIASPGASSQTISVRFGDDSVDALDLNADGAGNRRYGGAYASTLEVVEYMP